LTCFQLGTKKKTRRHRLKIQIEFSDSAEDSPFVTSRPERDHQANTSASEKSAAHAKLFQSHLWRDSPISYSNEAGSNQWEMSVLQLAAAASAHFVQLATPLFPHWPGPVPFA